MPFGILYSLILQQKVRLKVILCHAIPFKLKGPLTFLGAFNHISSVKGACSCVSMWQWVQISRQTINDTSDYHSQIWKKSGLVVAFARLNDKCCQWQILSAVAKNNATLAKRPKLNFDIVNVLSASWCLFLATCEVKETLLCNITLQLWVDGLVLKFNKVNWGLLHHIDFSCRHDSVKLWFI